MKKQIAETRRKEWEVRGRDQKRRSKRRRRRRKCGI